MEPKSCVLHVIVMSIEYVKAHMIHKCHHDFDYLYQTLEQFEYAGCDNCERVLRLKNNKENILLCTSPNFDG